MQCRNCGTEIADKAIICYRCGVGTTDPVRKPAPLPSSGTRLPLLAGLVPLILALAVLAGAQATGDPREMEAAAAVLAVIGVLILITRAVRRR